MPYWNVCGGKTSKKRTQLFEIPSFVPSSQFVFSNLSRVPHLKTILAPHLVKISSSSSSFAGEQRSAAPSSIILEMKKPKNGQAAHRSRAEGALIYDVCIGGREATKTLM